MNTKNLITSTYNDIARQYAKLYFKLTPEDIPNIDKFFSYLKPESKVLDVGCGPGGGIAYSLKKGFEAVGVDISPKMIKIATQKVPKGKFYVMNMVKMNFTNESFDGLMAAHSIIHIPSKKIPEVLAEFKRVLRPSGILLALVLEGKPDQIVDEPMKAGAKIFLNLFTQKRLANFIKNAGFKILEQNTTSMIGIDGSTDKGICIIAKK